VKSLSLSLKAKFFVITLLSLTAIVGISYAATQLTKNLDTQACQTSGTVSICQVTPAQGTTNGGNTIIVEGAGYPEFSQTTDYSQNGLVFHLDAINNTGEGDYRHDDATSTWKNLASFALGTYNDYDKTIPDGTLCRTYLLACTAGEHPTKMYWTNNSLHFAGNSAGTADEGWVRVLHDLYYDNLTFEVTMKTAGLTARNDIIGTNTATNGILYGNYHCGNGNQISFTGETNNNVVSYAVGDGVTTYPKSTCVNVPNNTIFSNSVSVTRTTASVSPITKFTISNTTATKESSGTPTVKEWVNNESTVNLKSGSGYVKGTAGTSGTVCNSNGVGAVTAGGSATTSTHKPLCYFAIGADPNNNAVNNTIGFASGDIYSVRIYNRAISEPERTKNAQVDQARFLNPPEIMIGTQACTDPLVLNSTQIQCVVPASLNNEIGKVNVSVTYDSKTVTLANAYEYQKQELTSISPASGPKAGGTKVTITGNNFPYAGTDDVVQDGLIAQYDGINNAGMGDKFHDSSLNSWVNLAQKEPGIYDYMPDLVICSNKTYACTPGTSSEVSWISDGLQFTNNVNSWLKLDRQFKFANYTNEIVYAVDTLPDVRVDLFSSNIQNTGMLLSSYMCSNVAQVRINQLYYNAGTSSGDIIDTGGKLVQSKCLSLKANEIMSIAFNNSSNPTTGTDLGFYINGYGSPTHVSDSALQMNSGAYDGNCGALGKGSSKCYVAFGNDANDNAVGTLPLKNGRILAIRTYNRSLTQTELIKNADADHKRFSALPTVKVGEKNCINLVVISKTQLTCTIDTSGSAETVGTDKEVTITYNGTVQSTLSGASGFEFTENNVLNIFDFSPASAPSFGGTSLNIDGNFPEGNTFTVTIAGNNCPITATTTSKLTCTLPPAGTISDGGTTPAEIIVTQTTNATRTVSALGFEYLTTSKDPVSFKVQQDNLLYKLISLNIDQAWDGVHSFTVTYPTDLRPSFTTVATPTGWTVAGGVDTGTITFTSTRSMVSADVVQNVLSELTFAPASGSANPNGSLTADGGKISIQLHNNLWG
jgi:hypothetical protein